MTRSKGSIGKPRSFDPHDLRQILKPIHDKLAKAGVREERMPGNDMIVSKLLDWIDTKKVDEWVRNYAKTME